MSIRTLVLCTLLTLPFAAPALAAAEETNPYETLLLERGVAPEDLDDVVVERRTLVDGAWTVEILTLDDLATMPTVAPAPVAAPDVVVGQLPLHFMFQLSCAGYGAETLAEGVTKVEGAWDFGVHALLPVIAGGAAIDASEPQSLVTGTAHADQTALAVGDLSISETRVSLFGICFFLLGTMSGTGTFAFDVASPI